MVHSSCCSASMAPTSRTTEASSEKIRTTFERRFAFLLSRSSGLFDHTLRQCSGGKAVNARTSVLAAVMSSATRGNCFVRSLAVSSDPAVTAAGSGCMNTIRNAAATMS